jgi:hypothetical protein
MRLLRFLAFIVLALAIPAAAQVSYSAADSNSNDAKRYPLSGTVVNSVTGEPIRRALVTLFYMRQMSAMTDSNGHFEFDGLPRMRATVAAQKPGFFSEQELSGGRGRPSQFTVGPDATEAVVKLVPEAIIMGRIVDPDGLPIRGLMVRAVAQKVVQGRKEWQQGMTARTDADGYYRIISLMPGSYFLIAGPGRAPAFVAGVEDTSDLGYPAVTYPGNSAPLRISAGQQIETNFTVKPEPFYSVTGSVSGISPSGHYTVQLIPRTPGMQMPVSGANPDAESGTFKLPQVPRGDYILQARGFNQDPRKADAYQHQLYGAVPLNVHGNLMGVTIPLESMLTVPVNVHVERTRQAPVVAGTRKIPGVQISLKPLEPGHPSLFSGLEDPKDANSPLVIRNAMPGKYRVTFLPSFGDTYVASAVFGTSDLLNGEITLTQSSNQGVIDVVVRDDAANLTVKVLTEEPVGGVSVLIVPDRGEPRLTETDAGPNETGTPVRGLRPGIYTVLAFEDIGNLEYMNRDALEPYLSHGAKVTLAPNQEATVTPELIKRGGE